VGVGEQGGGRRDRCWPRRGRGADEIALKAPTAIKFLKASFNADTEHQAGLSMMASAGLKVYVESEEAREGAAAFADKRIPDFANFAV